MARQRPGALTAAAVLCIVFGSLALICGLLGIVGLAMQNQGIFGGPDQKQMDLIEQKMPGYRVVNATSTFLTLAVAAALLSAGIGLLTLKPWSRLLAIVFLFVSIAHLFTIGVYNLVFVLPNMTDILGDQPGIGQQEKQVVVALGGIMIVIMYLIPLIYQVITLIVILRPSVKQAVAQAGLSAFEADQESRRAEDDYRRPPPENYDEGWDLRRPADDPKDERFH